MQTGLSGRTVIVTGASGGLGSAIGRAFAAEHAAAALTFYQNEQRAAEVASSIHTRGGRAAAIRFDQSTADGVPALLQGVEAELGPPDVIVANAVEWPSIDVDGELEALQASLATNLLGPLALVDAALAGMRDRGFGRIVFVSSDVVGQPLPGPLAYATAKGAIETAARVLAVREARYGILTNTVRPGLTLTERVRTNPRFGEAVIAAESATTPTGRICTPEDVASATVYLGSRANTHINGQVVSIAGGRELTR
jgi:2-hydroxycyclohexanecarboxyl-CoA dehydrogenase